MYSLSFWVSMWNWICLQQEPIPLILLCPLLQLYVYVPIVIDNHLQDTVIEELRILENLNYSANGSESASISATRSTYKQIASSIVRGYIVTWATTFHLADPATFGREIEADRGHAGKDCGHGGTVSYILISVYNNSMWKLVFQFQSDPSSQAAVSVDITGSATHLPDTPSFVSSVETPIPCQLSSTTFPMVAPTYFQQHPFPCT